VDLKTVKDFTFTASAGLVKDRFVLNVSNILTGTENPVIPEESFNIYYGNNMINIQTLSDLWDGKTGSIRIMDFAGKTISYNNNEEFRKNSLIQISAPGTQGIYFVELKSKLMRHVRKVVVK